MLRPLVAAHRIAGRAGSRGVVRAGLVAVALGGLMALASPVHGWIQSHPASAAIDRSDRADTVSASTGGSGDLPDPLPKRPTVGSDIGARIQTCVRSRTRTTATRGQDCAAWALSGPVNVVILGGGDPRTLLRAPWRPALGQWLVAQAYVDDTGGCQAGWRDSAQQFELRLDRLTRRHFKAVVAHCAPGVHGAILGEAHTDQYDLRHCGGDHMIDLDSARDALVHSLLALPGTRVAYEQVGRANSVYPSGCGGLVTSDGRVAYVTLAGAA